MPSHFSKRALYSLLRLIEIVHDGLNLFIGVALSRLQFELGGEKALLGRVDIGLVVGNIFGSGRG